MGWDLLTQPDVPDFIALLHGRNYACDTRSHSCGEQSVMNVFSFHLAECGITQTPGALLRPPGSASVSGPMHAECLVPMTLGLPVGTLSTFSIWRTQRAMTDMVHGHSSAPFADRHASAMQERLRKDFHHEFTTLRFRAISERGSWQGKNCLLPGT